MAERLQGFSWESQESNRGGNHGEDVPQDTEEDPVIVLFQKVVNRAKLGRFRTRVSGPKADADTAEVWRECARHALQDINATTPARFTCIVQSCAAVGFSSNELFLALIEAVRGSTGAGLDRFTATQVGVIVESFGLIAKATIGQKHCDEGLKIHYLSFVSDLLERCRVKRVLWNEDFNPNVLSSVMYGLGWLRNAIINCSSVPKLNVLGEVTARAFLHQIQSKSPCSGPSFADFLHGCANFRYGNHQILKEVHKEFNVWLALEDNLSSMTDVDLLRVVWAYSCKEFGDDGVLPVLVPAIAAKCPEMSNAGLSNMILVLGKVGGQTDHVMNTLVKEATSSERLKSCKNQHIVRIISGLGKARYGNRDIFAILSRELLKTKRLLRFSLDETLTVLEGIADAGVIQDDVLNSILEIIWDSSDTLSPSQVVTLMGTLANIKKRVELMHQDTKLVDDIIDLVAHLTEIIPRGALGYGLDQVVDLFSSFGQIRYFDYKVLQELLKRYYSLVNLESSGQEVSWSHVGRMLRTYAVSNMQNCVQPTFEVHRLFAWTHDWVTLNLVHASSVSDLASVLWGLVRFSARVRVNQLERICRRMRELMAEGKPVRLQDWRHLVFVDLCLRYVYGLNVAPVSRECTTLLDLAKEHWRDGMRDVSGLNKGVTNYIEQVGVPHKKGQLLVENLYRADVLVENLAIIYDGKVGYQENKIDHFRYPSMHKHRLLMGDEYFRNEVLEAAGFKV